MRTVAWKVTVEDVEHICTAQTSTAAIRKAVKEYIKEHRNGHDLRLGQGTLKIEVGRSHATEMKSWQAMGNKILM